MTEEEKEEIEQSKFYKNPKKVIEFIEQLESQLYDLEKQRKTNKINCYLVNYTVIGENSCSL